MITSYGKIIYSPVSHLKASNNWAILSCDDEIGKYYRHLFNKEYPYLNSQFASIKLQRPTWSSHISFIRDEEIPNKQFWKYNSNKIIEFEYYPQVFDSGKYFWLNVKCDYLLNLRQKFGLPKFPKYGLHLTIGIIAAS